MQQYSIKTRGIADSKPMETGKTFHSLDKAIASVFDLIDFIQGDVSEILICSEDNPVYSVKPLSDKQFIVQELY